MKTKHMRLSMILTMIFTFSQNGLADPKHTSDNGWDEYTQGNLVTAIEMLTQAANEGDASGQARLGYILDKAGSTEEAFKWFQKSAEQHYPEGQYGLGMMYESGQGVQQNIKLAGQLIKQSAEQGYLLAMRAYGLALVSGNLGFKADLALAGEWIQRAAEQGDGTAIHRLIKALKNGELNLKKDMKKADYWQTQLTIPKPKLRPTKGSTSTTTKQGALQ